MSGALPAVLLAALLVLGGGCAGKPPVPTTGVPEGVSFSVTPSDAELLVDNVVQGKASEFPDDRPLRVPVGLRTLELRAPDYEPWLRRFEITRHPKKIEATLRRKEPAAAPNGRTGLPVAPPAPAPAGSPAPSR